MSINRQTFAANLKAGRQKMQWSQSEAAEATGTTLKAWGSYEQGHALPPVDTLTRICSALGIDDMMGLVTRPNFFTSKCMPRKVKPTIETRYRALKGKPRQIVDMLLGITA